MDIQATIQHNLEEVRGRIAEACRRSGRDADSVQLVAVTKTRGIEAIRALITSGQTVLGENRIQEALPKIEQIAAEWHLIGHLQTNKAKHIPGKFRLVHSVDNARLIKALNAAAQDEPVHCLLQVNMSGEKQKSGCEPSEALPLLDLAASLPHIQMQGLMTMAALTDDPELARPAFARLRQLRDQLLARGIPKETLAHLSMGMSGDYEVAIEEGATLVRVGSAIFKGINEVQQ